ncbi:hypothetical protein FHT76_006971 [Rhizobium sp. BK176]|nr:hypothetical protein [Rhizobium sp. BK181]MBB3543375.1 hypothetical protein [Rhizobium sp. BK399]MCS3743569.1 hypothetical protein [Rhizobium sp. BK661]MCS4095261.1 hypothetical protein [Rhizobium sp. BK176]
MATALELASPVLVCAGLSVSARFRLSHTFFVRSLTYETERKVNSSYPVKTRDVFACNSFAPGFGREADLAPANVFALF